MPLSAMASAMPTNDCDREADKQQADTLKEWVRELARAVNFAIETEPVLVEVAKLCGPTWKKKGGEDDVEKLAEDLENARVILDMQKMALSRGQVKPGDRGIPQGWSEVLKAEEQKVKDDFKISMLAASLVKATLDADGVAGLKEGDAKGVAELLWEKREKTLPGKGVVETERPDTPDSDCKE